MTSGKEGQPHHVVPGSRPPIQINMCRHRDTTRRLFRVAMIGLFNQTVPPRRHGRPLARGRSLRGGTILCSAAASPSSLLYEGW